MLHGTFPQSTEKNLQSTSKDRVTQTTIHCNNYMHVSAQVAGFFLVII